MIKIAIYGKNGQIAQCLKDVSKPTENEISFFGRPEIQIDDYTGIYDYLKQYKVDILVNASAYNFVDDAEKDKETALKINANGPKLMAQACKELNIPFIHLSTDYVFSGDKNSPYKEDDLPNPINFYGKSKLMGEELVSKTIENYVILRTTWIYSIFANNFPKTILKNAINSNGKIDVIENQIACPTSGISLANAIIKIAKKLILEPQNQNLRGLFHACSQSPTSRYDYAKYIFSIANKYGLHTCNLNPVSSNDFFDGAKRPIYSALNSDKLRNVFNIEIENWQTGIEKTIKEIAKIKN